MPESYPSTTAVQPERSPRLDLSRPPLFGALLLAVLTGCSTSSGVFTVLPTGHYVLKSTRTIAAATPLSANLARELQKTVLPAYYVQPGDVLVIEPTDFEAVYRFAGDQTVMPDGSVDLGQYGRIIVAGMTLEEIEAQVETLVEAVEGEIEPINVRLVGPESVVYYVLGEVNAPSAYPWIGRETVLDAILSAGGLSDEASPCKIYLSRPTFPDSCRVVLPICYNEIVQLGDTTTNFQVMPGDRIYVGTRSLWEHLRFWDHGCKRCRGSLQCPCPDPAMIQYRTPITRLPPVDILPESIPPQTPEEPAI